MGHSGTLDPFADGVLILGIGKSTKKLSEIIEYDKRYKGLIKLGKKTDTKDLTGTVIDKRDIRQLSDALIDNEFRFTEIASKGGFLRAGNITLLLGVDNEQVDSLVELIKQYCHAREEAINIAKEQGLDLIQFLVHPLKPFLY